MSIHQDHQGFIWIGTENGLNRFDGKYFLEFRFDPEDPETLDDNWINTIYEDSQNNLWIGTKMGMNRLNRKTGKIERIPLMSEGQNIKGTINNIYEVSAGQLWITTPFKGLFKLEQDQEDQNWKTERFVYREPGTKAGTDLSNFNIAHATAHELWVVNSIGIDYVEIPSRKFVHYPFPEKGLPIQVEYDKSSGVYDGKGRFFAGVGNRLFVLDTNKKGLDQAALELLTSTNNQGIPITRKLLFDSPGKLLVPFYRNLALYDLENGAYEFFEEEGQSTQELLPHPIHATFKDKYGNYWIGTAGGGLFFGQNANKSFTFLQHDPTNSNSISPGQVRSFLEDEKGNIWTGIILHGLDYLVRDRGGNLMRDKSVTANLSQANALPSSRLIKLIPGDNKSIWIATNDSGIINIDENASVLEMFKHRSNDPNSLSSNRIWGLVRDQKGFIWAGNWQEGLNQVDPRSGSVKRFYHDPTNKNSIISNKIRCLFMDEDGILWIGTFDGLDKYDPVTGRFTHFQHDPEDPSSLSNNLVWSIYKDRKGDLWVGTNTGLNRYDEEKRGFEHFYEKNGLPDNSIYGILEDDDGIIWISTQNGLARQLPTTSDKSFFPLGLANGLETVSFIPKAYLNSSSTNQLFFGSSDGILIVNPSSLNTTVPQPKFAIHRLNTFNPFEENNPPMDYFIGMNKESVKLGHRDQSITFTLSDLHWGQNKGLRYDYQLVGFNQQWMPLAADMQMTFTSLPPGKYRL